MAGEYARGREGLDRGNINVALFGIKTRSQNQLDREVVEKFIDDTARRLASPNPYTNPFKGSIRSYVKKEIYVVNIEPLYFNFTVLLWPVAAIMAWVSGGFTPWLLLPVGLGCLGVFWSRRFFYFVCVKGLRKAGYRGPVVMLTPKQIIEAVVL